MEHKDIIKNIISDNGGIAKLSVLTSAGVPKEKIYKLCSDGFLQRVSKERKFFRICGERLRLRFFERVGPMEKRLF